MASLYDQIPRVELQTLDGNLVAIKSRPISEKVLILAPAVDGPTEQIMSVDNPAVMASLFGPLAFDDSNYTRPSGVSSDERFNGNYLMKALKEALSGGAASVRLLRVGGTKATGTLSITGNAASGDLDGEAVYAGRIYNQASVQFVSGATSGRAVISQADAKGGSFTLTWSGASSGLTVREIVDRINRDKRNKSIKLKIDTVSPTAAARLLHGTVTLTGGLDGTMHDDSDYRKSFYDALTDADTGVFQMLEDLGEDSDIVVIAGLYLDDQVTADGDAAKTTTSVAVPFAEYLARRSGDYPQIGVLGTRPLADASDRSKVTEHYDALVTSSAGTRGSASDKWINAGYFMHAGFRYQNAAMGLDVDAGGYLQVVAADVVLNDREIDLYVESAAAIYAGTLARLKPHKAASSADVRGIFDVPYLFSRGQVNALTAGMGRDTTQGNEGAGSYVTVRRNRGIVFTRDVTAAFRTSDFKDLQPLRLANAVHKGIKEIAEPYLSGNNDLAIRLALETQIKSFLDGLADAGALMGGEGIGYDLRVRGGDTDPLSNLLGVIHIDVTLVPALQIKAINVKVRLGLSL